MIFLFLLCCGVFCSFAQTCNPCKTAGWDVGPISTFNPFWTLALTNPPPCLDLTTERKLMEAKMTASVDQHRIHVPFSLVKNVMISPDSWPLWNILFNVVSTTWETFKICSPFEGFFVVCAGFLCF